MSKGNRTREQRHADQSAQIHELKEQLRQARLLVVAITHAHGKPLRGGRGFTLGREHLNGIEGHPIVVEDLPESNEIVISCP